MKHCSLHDDALCVLSTLHKILNRDGELTVRIADLQGALGVTAFRERCIYLRPGMTFAEWRSTLTHELVHAYRGAVPADEAAREEVLVQHATARLLIPSGSALSQLDQRWKPEDITDLAARFVVDHDTVETALNPPTIPLMIPSPRTPAE